MTVGAEVFSLFKQFGNEAYGEDCSQTSHAVQGALLAKHKGFDDELIIATFLHDIGHIYPLTLGDNHPRMGDLGMQAHDKWGEQFLRERGFSERVITPVANHAATKRYLCSTRVDYFAKLSATSVETLKYQGGLMNADEIEAFERTPYLAECITLRCIDDEAKAIDFEVNDNTLQAQCDLIDSYLSA